MATNQFRVVSILLAFGVLSLGVSSLQAQYCDQIELTPSNGQPDGMFGTAVAIDADMAVVGAPGPYGGTQNGLAYIFHRSAAGWDEVAVIHGRTPGLGDQYGFSTAIDGDTVLVGAYGDDTAGPAAGLVYVYRLSGSTWIEEAVLQAGDASAGAWFGFSVALDGDLALVGAMHDDQERGAAYLFRRSGTTWTEVTKLTTGPASDPGDLFGRQVVLQGHLMAISAPHDSGGYRGSVYVFAENGGTWFPDARFDGEPFGQIGYAVSLEGDLLAFSVSAQMVSVYRRLATKSWSHEADLTGDGAWYSLFGQDVAVKGDRILVGDPYDDENAGIGGTVYVYAWDGSSWQRQVKLFDCVQIGWSVAVTDGYMISGAPTAYQNQGAAGVRLFTGEVAAWQNYGTGWPGTTGVPSLDLTEPPILGAEPTVRIGNSLGQNTLAAVLVGLSSASIGTGLDGTLLVVPMQVTTLLLPAAGSAIAVGIPCDLAFDGIDVYLQVLEIDPGASKGVSFSRGLETHLGSD